MSKNYRIGLTEYQINILNKIGSCLSNKGYSSEHRKFYIAEYLELLGLIELNVKKIDKRRNHERGLKVLKKKKDAINLMACRQEIEKLHH